MLQVALVGESKRAPQSMTLWMSSVLSIQLCVLLMLPSSPARAAAWLWLVGQRNKAKRSTSCAQMVNA